VLLALVLDQVNPEAEMRLAFIGGLLGRRARARHIGRYLLAQPAIDREERNQKNADSAHGQERISQRAADAEALVSHGHIDAMRKARAIPGKAAASAATQLCGSAAICAVLRVPPTVCSISPSPAAPRKLGLTLTNVLAPRAC